MRPAMDGTPQVLRAPGKDGLDPRHRQALRLAVRGLAGGHDFVCDVDRGHGTPLGQHGLKLTKPTRVMLVIRFHAILIRSQKTSLEILSACDPLVIHGWDTDVQRRKERGSM